MTEAPQWVPLRTKWYIFDLDTRKIETSHVFNRFWDAIDWGHGKFQRYTALSGKYLLRHPGMWNV